ncbi:MAG: hypothetical protein WCK67_08635 [bacterium]
MDLKDNEADLKELLQIIFEASCAIQNLKLGKDKIEKLRVAFIGNEVTQNGITNLDLFYFEVNFGFVLKFKKETPKGGFYRDLRYEACDQKDWVLNNNLSWGVDIENKFRKEDRWDFSLDGNLVCFRNNYLSCQIFEVEWLDLKVIEKYQKMNLYNKITLLIRQQLLKRLCKIIKPGSTYTYYEGFESDFKKEHAINLIIVRRGEFNGGGVIRLTPDGESIAWIYNHTLGWPCSWDFDSIGNYALCRVEYDDYITFKIEILDLH